jgi:hypothetical protein
MGMHCYGVPALDGYHHHAQLEEYDHLETLRHSVRPTIRTA